MVVSNVFYFHPYLGKIAILTNIFQMGWFNHQPVMFLRFLRIFGRKACSCPHLGQADEVPDGFKGPDTMDTLFTLFFTRSIWMFPKIVVFPPKSSILIGFSIINHPFWCIHIFWKHLYQALTFVAFRSCGRNGLLKPVNTKR